MKTLRIFLIFLALCLSMESMVGADNRGVINPGECRIETLTYPGQIDIYTFTGEQGKYAIIKMSNESSVNPSITIKGPDGQVKYSAYCSAYTWYQLISDFQISQTGPYTIEATSCSGTAGDYSLSILIVPGAAEGGYICSGETKIGSLECLSDLHAYYFNGKAGQGLSISESVLSDNMRYAPEIYLCDPDGNVEINTNVPPIVDHQLLQSGTYTIVTTYNFISFNYPYEAGDYRLSVALAPAVDTDGDGLEDICDNCPDDFNPGQENCDGDALGNVCDPDPCITTTSSMTTVSSTTTTASGSTTSVVSSTTTTGPTTTTSRNNIIKCIIEIIFPDDQDTIELLRYYRDNVLSKTPEGRVSNRYYLS